MGNIMKRLIGLSTFALLLSVGACSDVNPVQPLSPSDSPAESLSLVEDLRALVNGESPDLSARYNEAIIGPDGGSLYVDLHYLYVPRGAVKGPTRFTLQLRDDHGVGAELTATSVDRHGRATGRRNNVGSAGFSQQVYLTFSYQHAFNAPLNPFMIKVVEIMGDRLIPQPTYVNPFFKTATGVLHHFSDYGLAWPSRASRR